MSKSLYIDVNTGEVRTALNGAVAKRLKLYLRDLTPLKIAFHQNGTVITSTVLESEAAGLKVGLRVKPGQGLLMALATSYAIASEEAAVILSLNTTEITDYFNALPASQFEAEMTLEVEVTSADDSERVTYFQAPILVGREVNMDADQTPSAAAANGATLHIAGETVGSGRFLHILSDGTVVYADASNDRPAHGYTKEAVTAGQPVTLWRGLYLNGLSGLTPGATYYLSSVTLGFYTSTPPTTGIVQRLGVADNATTLYVDLEPKIILAA